MFFDPSTTGLVVLGASQFNFCPDHDRVVFRLAQESVIKYFRDPRLGLGLREKTIFNGFDRDEEKGHLLFDLIRFMGQFPFADLFVYVCSHGFAYRQNFLKIFLKNSRNDDMDSFLDFEEFIAKIMDESKARVYCIVDCCGSGVIHKNSTRLKISPPHASYLTSENQLALPKTGITIITSNNMRRPGTVVARDDHPSMNAPLFSHVLLELLQNGTSNLPGEGLRFEDLHRHICERIPTVICELNKELEDADRPLISDVHDTYLSEYSDRPVFDGESGNLLSTIGAFPNNHPNHRVLTGISRTVRHLYSIKYLQYDRIEELEGRLEKQEAINSKLEADNKALREELDQQYAKFAQLKGDDEVLRNECEAKDATISRMTMEYEAMGQKCKLLDDNILRLADENIRLGSECEERARALSESEARVRTISRKNATLERFARRVRRGMVYIIVGLAIAVVCYLVYLVR